MQNGNLEYDFIEIMSFLSFHFFMEKIWNLMILWAKTDNYKKHDPGL